MIPGIVAALALLAVAVADPGLEANQDLGGLREERPATEGAIASARRSYDGAVLRLSTRIQRVLSDVAAAAFNITEREYVEADGASRGPVSVQF